jgi:hypothetical protein
MSLGAEPTSQQHRAKLLSGNCVQLKPSLASSLAAAASPAASSGFKTQGVLR